MKLTEHFSYEELGIVGAEQRIIDNYMYLCLEVMEPVREHFNSIVHVNDGHRDTAHNFRVGGKEYSYHLSLDDHAAIDFTVMDVNPVPVFEWIYKSSGLMYDKVILEKKNGVPIVVHLQIRRVQKPRRQAFIGGTGDSQNYELVSG